MISSRSGAGAERLGYPGLSTTGRVVLVLSALVSLSIVGRAAIDIYGFSPLGYKGRGHLAFAEMSASFEISIADKRRSMAQWLNRSEADLRSLASQLRGSAAMPIAADAGDSWKSTASGLFAAGLAKNTAYREFFIADSRTGRLLLSSSSPPFAASMELRRFDEEGGPFVFADAIVFLAPLISDGSRSGPEWLGLVVDPEAFFRQIVPVGEADAEGLDWTLVDGQGKVFASNLPLLFPIGSKLSPESGAKPIFQAGAAMAFDLRGAKLLGMFSEPLPLVDGGIRLFVFADRKTLDAPLGTEVFASLLLNVLFGLASIAFTWLVLRRVFLPYHRLAEAVRAFAEGNKPRLPSPAKGEIGYLVAAFGELMAKVSIQRSTLEMEVKSRTGDLSIMNAATRALALSSGDDEAYLSLLDALLEGLGVESGLMVFFNGRNEARAVFAEGREAMAIDGSMLSEVEKASKSSGSNVELLGEAYEGCVGARLAIGTDAAGYILIGRRVGNFQAREVEAVNRVLKDLSPLVYERRERSRREETKAAAELELRRSEVRLRTFFEESRDMIYTANGDDIIAWINDAGIELLGLSDRFEAVGRKFSEFALSPEDREIFLGDLRTRGYARDYEIVLRKADGSPMFCIETAHSLRTHDGSLTEIQGIVKDISERINKEKELWRTNLELNSANARLRETQMLVVQREKLASIGQLSAGIAHEINNPLGFLKSNHEVLQGFLGRLRTAWDEASALDPSSHAGIAERLDLDYVFAQVAEIVRESDDGFRRIVEIVKTLRNFAREDSEIKYSKYDIEEGIRSTLIVARNAIKYVAGVELALAGVPLVEAAGGEINQVLLNIVMNAAQAIEGQKRQTEGRILIATSSDGDHVVVSVDDDGPGIPEASRLRVFDPFFTTKEPGKGTGLGLSISYDIVVKKHGGRLTVDDSPLGGARFLIELPIEHPHFNEALDPSRDSSLAEI